jgi:DNA-binding IclR family transcriptional regulator
VPAPAGALEDHTVAILALQDGDAVVLEVRLGRRPLPLTPRPGVRMTAWSSPAGRHLLAALPDDRLDAVVTAAAGRLGVPRPDRAQLAPELAQLRASPRTARVYHGAAITEVSCRIVAEVPVTVVLQLPAADAERHGTEQLRSPVERLAGRLASAP